MIDLALNFICEQLDSYLAIKYQLPGSQSLIQIDNIAWHDTANMADGDNKGAFISLVNIEEDRLSKSNENFTRNSVNGNITYKNPKLFLNLYLLFSVNLSKYDESLKRLSYIIQFFQYQHVFTRLTTPGDSVTPFPKDVDELIFDLHTLSFQDLNNLWGIMGSKYVPSVLYKMRLIVIDENFTYGTAIPIQRINVNKKTLQL